MPSKKALIGCVLLALLLSSGAIAATTQQFEVAELYMAADEDPNASESPQFAPMPLSVVASVDTGLRDYATSYDFYYLSTTPTDIATGNNIFKKSPYFDFSFDKFRRDKHQSRLSGPKTSIWPVNDDQRTDGVFIKDAYIDTTSFIDGYRFPTNDSLDQFVIPESGGVYTTMDFRVVDPDQTCSVRNDTKICNDLSPGETSVERELTIGDQSYVSYQESDDPYAGEYGTMPGLIRYADAPHDASAATVRANITVHYTNTTKVFTRTNATADWELNTTSQNDLVRQHSVSEDLAVQLTSEQTLMATQRVINRSSEEDIIVLEFSGPKSISDRRLWSYAKVSEGVLVENVWGLYSARTAREGMEIQNGWGHPREKSYPVMPGMYLTSKSDSVKTLFVKSSTYSGVRVTSANYSHFDTPHPIVTKENILLPNKTPRRTTEVVIRGSTSGIEALRDLHNEKIPVETTHHEYHETTISVDRLDDSTVKIILRAEDGSPVPNREVAVSVEGAGTLTTNKTGVATVETKRDSITVEFSGDRFTEDHAVYYGPASTTTVFGVDSPIYTQLARIFLTSKVYMGALMMAIGIMLVKRFFFE